ncbi:MAG: PAAR domain-containing protein [Thermoanaerobaculaceae bacterium]|jgi:uncharacterized Zn-binding protein involved in type VI secretion|nr:PAAR domain-containing protein [Thermoanaerobaculaceae bacterium]
MSFPAARITSTTAHGGTVSLGTPLTLIGNMPASRMGDLQVCPMLTPAVPPIPHVGGPIVLGAFNVLVGGPPQARMTDMTVCVGPPGVIVTGHFTTLVGMAGAFSGGLGGFLGLVLGGVLAALESLSRPYPRSVLRPDGSIVTEYSPNITITGSPEYQAAVVRDLNHPDNRAIVDALNGSGRHVTIQPIPPGRAQNNGGCRRHSDDALATGLNGTTITRGAGSDSTVSYNPTWSPTYRGQDGSTATEQPHQVLNHELTHAYHNARGENLRDFGDPADPTGNQEESRTMGINRWQHEAGTPSEGDMLEANGMPRPRDHDSIVSETYQGSDGQWYQDGTDATGTHTHQQIQPGSPWPSQ